MIYYICSSFTRFVATVCDHHRQSEERSRNDRLLIAAFCTFCRLHARSHHENVKSTCAILRWLLHCRSTASRLQFDFPMMSKNAHGSDVTANILRSLLFLLHQLARGVLHGGAGGDWLVVAGWALYCCCRVETVLRWSGWEALHRRNSSLSFHLEWESLASITPWLNPFFHIAERSNGASSHCVHAATGLPI